MRHAITSRRRHPPTRSAGPLLRFGRLRSLIALEKSLGRGLANGAITVFGERLERRERLRSACLGQRLNGGDSQGHWPTPEKPAIRLRVGDKPSDRVGAGKLAKRRDQCALDLGIVLLG